MYFGQAEAPLWERLVRTGADVFSTVYSAVKGRVVTPTSGTTYPSPYPQTPDIIYGKAQLPPQAPPPKADLTLPLLAGAGAFLLIMTMRRR